MNTKITTLFAMILFSLMLMGGSAYAYPPGYWDHNAIRPYPAGEHAMGVRRAMNWRTFEASWLIGQRVNGRSGNYIGQISNLVVDQVNDRVALVVLSNVPGFGTDQVAIPYGCLERRDHHTLTVRFPIMETAYVNNREDPDLYLLKQYPADSPLYSIPKPINPNWVAEVYRTYGRMPYWTQKGERALSAMELYEGTQVIGAGVDSPQGEVEARVEPRIADLIIDSSNGHILLTVLSNVKGEEGNRVAVPFEVLKRESKDIFALTTKQGALASSPRFHDFDMNSYRYTEGVYRHFGLQPPWTEGSRAKAMNPYRWGGEAQDF
jgi:sporulation protein YlmC with PRC-barrel domain